MSPSTAVSQTNDEARVLILGAGLAGLKCAHNLISKHGFSEDHVVLLEASTSIGGRIKTNTSFVEGHKVSGHHVVSSQVPFLSKFETLTTQRVVSNTGGMPRHIRLGLYNQYSST